MTAVILILAAAVVLSFLNWGRIRLRARRARRVMFRWCLRADVLVLFIGVAGHMPAVAALSVLAIGSLVAVRS